MEKKLAFSCGGSEEGEHHVGTLIFYLRGKFCT